MRKVRCVQMVVLLICLVLTWALINLRPVAQIQEQKTALIQALSKIENWQRVAVSQLDPILVEELQLDDYILHRYSQGDEEVNLYVGYYYSSSKVGAAHDPLVCFPGQGWQVSARQSRSLQFTNEEAYTINFSTLLAEKNGAKELVFYWYQAGSKATSGPLAQKLMLLRSKFLQQNEHNAFVRFSTTLNNESTQDGQKRILTFIQDFYPVFVKYIEGV